MKVITLKVDEDLLNRMNSYLDHTNMTRSELVRRAIRYYLDKQQSMVLKTRRIRLYDCF